MEIEMNLDESKNLIKEKEVDVELDIENIAFKKDLENILTKSLDKASDYIIKAMPISQNIKDVLYDAKDAFKTKDFKKILKTVVSSSIREGLEFLGTPITVIKDITKLTDVALKGGLRKFLTTSIDLVASKYVKNNLMGDIITKFFNKVKDYINSGNFLKKLKSGVDNIMQKTNKIKEMVSNWETAYDNMDIDSINFISKKISNLQRGISLDEDTNRQSKTVQNITNLINAKKEKLSDMQLQMCQNM